MCDNGRPAHASSPPGRVHRLARLEPLRRLEPVGPRHRRAARTQRQRGPRVMRDSSMALARIGIRIAHGEHRDTAERARRVRCLGGRNAAVAERRAGADDPGPDRADDDVEPRSSRPRQSRRDAHARDIAVHTCARRNRSLDEPSLLQRTHGVRQRHRQRAARHLHVRDPHPGSDPRAHRHELAVQRAADDRQPGQRLGERIVLLRVAHGRLQRRVRQLHHVGARLGRQLEPARQIGVQDVEAARAEPELTRLHVHEHLVAERNRPGQARIRDARRAVDLAPHEPFHALDDRRDAAAAEAKRHRARRRAAPASRRPSRRDRRPRSARSRCGCRSSRWRGSRTRARAG